MNDHRKVHRESKTVQNDLRMLLLRVPAQRCRIPTGMLATIGVFMVMRTRVRCGCGRDIGASVDAYTQREQCNNQKGPYH